MNIGIVSGGGFQGLTLVKDLQVFREHNNALVVTVLDVNEENVSKYFADRFHRIPYLSDPDFEETFFQVCKRNNIDCLLPATERELMFLCTHRKKFFEKGINALVPEVRFAEIVQNKSSLYRWAAVEKIDVVTPIEKSNLKVVSFPLLAKPNEGWGGRGVHVLQNENELDEFLSKENLDSFCVQPFIENADEFSVDFAIRFDKKISPIVVRKRVLTSGGYAVISVSVHDDELNRVINKVCNAMANAGGAGNFNIQFLKKSSTYYLIDVNARLGTSATFSNEYGFSFTEFLVTENPETFSDISLTKPYKCVRYLEELWLDQSPKLDGVETIVFDLDDTLFNQKEWMFAKMRGIRNALPENIDHVHFTNAAYLLLEESHKHDWFDILSAEFNITSEQKKKLIEAYRTFMPDGNFLFSDAITTLKLLKNKYRLVLLTDGTEKMQSQKVTQANLQGMFDDVVYNETREWFKPSKLGFNEVCARTKSNPARCIMIGENPVRDVWGSLNAGFRWAFWLKRSGSFQQYNKNLFTNLYRLDNFSEIHNLSTLLYYLLPEN